MNDRYDVVIAGRRCAGASFATLLARSGARVLLLDKDAMPSDHVLSTHAIHPLGMELLDALGVGDTIRDGAPPLRRVLLDFAGERITIEYPAGRAAYCPRRVRLDAALQHAAVSAGAHIVDRARVVGVIQRDGRVCGVRADVDGCERNFAADLVVGADGRRSSIARFVGAREYLGYDAPRPTYWGYWDAPRSVDLEFDSYFGIADDVIHAVFQTDERQLLIAGAVPVERVAEWRRDPARALRASLERDATIAPLIAAPPAGNVVGAVGERFFFREAVGNGWVLVGDAGHHKEYLLGDGITEALLQARSLAPAIARGTADALLTWWRARDQAAVPLYCAGRIAAATGRSTELQRLGGELWRRQELVRRMFEVMDRRRSPFEALPMTEALPWLVSIAARRRWGELSDMLRTGAEVLRLRRETFARSRVAIAHAEDRERRAA